ncbi:MAG: hypothetical protein JW716_04675 [Candidatus Aenigmarchaeota archaeon]|nr:hypothetical protein [Candidatus Aenigmarchaeota archaeon]
MVERLSLSCSSNCHAVRRGRKKGFVHMIEIIIVVVMAFFAFFQFSYITTPGADWQRTKLALLGNDVLAVMDKNDVNWFDKNEVDSQLKDMIKSTNIVYSIKLDNVIKQDIKIGCLCIDGETSKIDDMLKPEPMQINMENINFSVEQVSDIGSLLNPKYDVVILSDPSVINSINGNTANLMRYLGLDKGIIELFPLRQADVTGAQKEVFGLEWSSDIPDGSGRIIISPYARNPGSETYTVYKYFNSFPNTTGDGYFEIGHEFNDYLVENSKVISAGNNPQKILSVQRGTGAAAGILNWGMSDKKGRTAWLPIGIPTNEDEKSLLKSVVAWAGGRAEILKKTTMKNPVTVSRYSVYNSDMFQIVRIDLTLDYL